MDVRKVMYQCINRTNQKMNHNSRKKRNPQSLLRAYKQLTKIGKHQEKKDRHHPSHKHYVRKQSQTYHSQPISEPSPLIAERTPTRKHHTQRTSRPSRKPKKVLIVTWPPHGI